MFPRDRYQLKYDYLQPQHVLVVLTKESRYTNTQSPQGLELLEQNPIEDSIDIPFLKVSINKRKAFADATWKEEIDYNACLSTGNWNSTAYNDEIKSKFMNHLNLLARHNAIKN
jgi:hypothetical protein